MLTRARIAIFLILLSAHPLLAEPGTAKRRDLAAELSAAGLPVPQALRPQIDFWKQVFADHGDNQVVIHDTEDLSRIYRVLDFGDLAAVGLSAGEMERVRAENVDAEKAYVRGALVRIHQAAGDEDSLSDDERAIARLFRGAPHGAVLEASSPERIRAQRGIRERFGRGIAVSRRYLTELERLFRDEGVPTAVTRLALVESCFNVQAYSKVGAAGVWQFMPATGRLFMRVDDVIDERRDPLIAGRAAARFLRRNYDRLGTWPLAITAYNHGPGGMAKAVQAIGSEDIATIIRRYRGPLFGFASRNFYPEFIAAVEVEASYRDHFPDLLAERPVDTEWVSFPDAVTLSTALRATGLEREVFLDLNPSLGDRVRANTVPIPRRYSLRVPVGRAERTLALYAGMPKPRSQAKAAPKKEVRRAYVVHKVRKGQTLTQIARRYGTTVDRIRTANRLGGRSQIRVGQTLRVPTG